MLKSLLSAFTYTKNVTCGVMKANICHERTLSTVCCCYYFFRHNAIQFAKVGPTFSSLSPCPSLPSAETGERRQFQCLNIVLNNKTGPLFLNATNARKILAFWQQKAWNSSLKRRQLIHRRTNSWIFHNNTFNSTDYYTCLGNCSPTSPLSQH